MSDVPNGLTVQDPPHFEPPPPGPPLAPPSWPPYPPPWPQQWPPQPPSPKRRSPREVLAWVALVALFVGLGAVVGSQLGDSHTVATRPPASAATSGTTSADAPASIDAAVVDITTTLDGGQAAGTGMVISADGLVLTNNHVIAGSTSIEVQIGGSGPMHSAHVVGYSVSDDVAVIQIEGVSGLQAITTADSSSVQIGDRVTAIGNALGRPGPHAVTSGRVTALDQPITAADATGAGDGERLTGLIEFSASLQPGDSGGVLLNSEGDVIGVNTAASLRSPNPRSASTAGYAIPINHALDIAQKIEDGEGSDTIHIGERGILGVEIADGAPRGGVAVEGVASGSPAADAGIEAGDVIRSVDGRDIRSRTDIQAALNPHHPGDSVQVQWLDGAGQTHTADLMLQAGPPA